MAEQSGTLRWIRGRALAAHLMIVPLCAGISIAADGPTTAPAIATIPASPTINAPPEPPPEEQSLVDETHEDIQRNILEQVIRLDNFFGNVTTESHQKTEYQLRWRNSLRVDQDGRIGVGTTLRANFRLSKINERLKLVISGENEPEPLSPSLPEDPGNPGFERNAQQLSIVNAELRYGLLHTSALDLFLGAGALFIIPPEAFVRGRFQYTHKIDDVSLLRFSETPFVKNFLVLGETTEISLERLLNPKTLLRWANLGTISDEFTGLEWGTELSLIQTLSPRSGITVTGGVYGNTSINDWVTNYRVLARYRRNFLRSWLFYELEPEISWPRRADGSFQSHVAFSFRLEVLFQGKEK